MKPTGYGCCGQNSLEALRIVACKICSLDYYACHLRGKRFWLIIQIITRVFYVMSREQTVGLSHTMKVGNSSIERVDEFKYLGTTSTNQNSI